MQLQYVLANPSVATKKKKDRKKILKKRKKAKIKKVGGNSVKKLRKGSAATKRHMAKLRDMRGKKHKKPKRNPKGKHNAEGYYLIPKKAKPVAPAIPAGFRKVKFKYPDQEVVDEAYAKANKSQQLTDREIALVKQMSAYDLLVDPMGKKTVGAVKKYRNQSLKDTKKYLSELKARLKGQRKGLVVKDAGGQEIITKGNAKMKGRKKRKHGRRKHSKKRAHKNPVARLVQVNAKKKRKHRAKRNPSKKSNYLVKMVGRAKLGRKAAKSISRRRKLGIAVTIKNPIDLQSLAMSSLWAAGGYVVGGMLFKVADGLAKGQLSSAIQSGAGRFAPFVAPAIGIAMGFAMQMIAPKLQGAIGPSQKPGQKDDSSLASNVYRLGQGAIVVGGALAALAAVDMAMVFAKQRFPKLATLPVIGPAFGDVRFFPGGMSGADFGMYPQMGQYRQRPGDFGIIPQGMRGVEYFPNRGMSGVEFFPDGSIGDEMYKQSEQDDIAEAHGLGVIPAGLGGADFGSADYGIIPAGLGEEGQLG